MTDCRPEQVSPVANSVLLLVFNRPDLTEQLFRAVQRVRPPRLYIAADGARLDVPGEQQLVKGAKEVFNQIDWPCEVRTLYRTSNLGCKSAVSSAIDWFFQHEDQGIILEDDCIPSDSFFLFCDEMLERYSLDERVTMVTGNNFQNGNHVGPASYYFSRYPQIWGWATWRRAWALYDGDLTFFPAWSTSPAWKDFFSSRVERKYWDQIFTSAHAGLIDSWAYPWTASVWHSGGMVVTPNKNLVSNNGFRSDGTHTRNDQSPLASRPAEELSVLEHPEDFTPNLEADKYLFSTVHADKWSKFPLNLILEKHIDFLQRLRHSMI